MRAKRRPSPRILFTKETSIAKLTLARSLVHEVQWNLAPEAAVLAPLLEAAASKLATAIYTARGEE